MKEITSEHWETMSELHNERLDNIALRNQVQYLRKYLIVLGMSFYVVLTVAAVAIITSNHHYATIIKYEHYMDQQEIELQDLTHELFLLKQDNRLLEELGK